MDTSSPSALINNFANTVILNFNFKIFINLFYYSAAATIGVVTASKIITLLFEELIKVLHYRWEVRYRDKKELSTEVIRICIEGSVTAYTVKPRDYEHIYFIAESLEGVDEKAGEFFEKYVSRWNLVAVESQNPPVLKRLTTLKEWRDEADEAKRKLLEIVKKWR